MYPKFWTKPEGGVFFMKYTVEFKYECIKKYIKGEHIQHPADQNRHSFIRHVRNWTKRYQDLGYEGLKHSSKNKDWTKDERFSLVAKVLAGNSITAIASQAHINSGQLWLWVKKYREKGIDGLKCKLGRKPKVPIMNPKKNKLNPSESEELKLLRERNEYLEIENEYLKKLDALVAQREAKHLKAKKQK